MPIKKETIIEDKFWLVAELVGWNVEYQWDDEGKMIPGFVSIDHNVAYGGYNVSKVVTEEGGEQNLTPRRMTLTELDLWFDGVIYGWSRSNN